MNADLLKMLDLDGRDTPNANGLGIKAGGSATKSAASATCLSLDSWGMRRGRDCLERSEQMQKALGADGGAIEAAADFHGAAFEYNPKLNESCTDKARHDFMKTMLESPDYRGLHKHTRLNPTYAEIAATAFAERFGEYRKESEKTPPAKPGKPGRPGDEIAKEVATMGAVGQAIQQASQDVDEAQESSAAFGMGPGSPGSNDPKAIAALYKRVRSDPTLRRIVDLAGRFRRLAQSKQRAKAIHGYDDMVGVVQDGDVGRILPHELAMLTQQEFELDVLRRIAERQVMCREYKGTEPVAKGPIIPCIDQSSSMRSHGKLETSMALALTMAYIARLQKRWCCLVAWADRGSIRTLPLPPGRWDENALMDWLCHFFNGGTEPPLREMPSIYAQTKAPVGTTDILMITDGVCSVDESEQRLFTDWKVQAKARMTTLVIGCNSGGDIEVVSDEVFHLDSLTVESAAVQKAVSL